jgi:anti-sigma factor RsiW
MTLEISCVEVWREISDYLDGNIDAELRTRIEAHFKACKHCSAVYDGTRNVVRLIGDGRASASAYTTNCPNAEQFTLLQ